MPQQNTASNHTPRTAPWSPARRASHAAAIRRWKPWMKSTGPRTVAGKARAALNARKHGAYDRESSLIKQAVAAQRRFLCGALEYSRLYHQNPRNELLGPLGARLMALHALFDLRIAQAIEAHDYAKILLFRPPWGK